MTWDTLWPVIIPALVGGVLAWICYEAGKMEGRTGPRPSSGGCCHRHGGDGAALQPDPSPPGVSQPQPAQTLN